MSDQPERPRRRRRWLIAVVILLIVVAYSSWSNYSWHDSRFVGAWRVINSKSPQQCIYVLNADGTGVFQELLQNGEWHRRRDYRWSISRAGFHFENIDGKLSQSFTYITSFGGLTTHGKLRPFRFVSNAPAEIVSVDADTITLCIRQEGILMPLFLTLERIDPKHVPVCP